MKIKNTKVEKTPFMELVIKHEGEKISLIRLYWASNISKNGQQACWKNWVYPQGKEVLGGVFEGKTNISGSCPETKAFNEAINCLHFIENSNSPNYNKVKMHCKGGNYHEMTKSALIKASL